MSPSSLSPGAAPLPPLPDLSGGGRQAAPGDQQSAMASILSGILPVKSAVDGIFAACRQIQQSGSVPGSEQVCNQIIALATSLLPMAAQQALQPGVGSGGPVPPVGA